MGYTTYFHGDFDIVELATGDPKLLDRYLHLELNLLNERDHRDDDDVPGIWCQWVPTQGGSRLAWDEGEKFYDYLEWLTWIVEHKLSPNGYGLSGRVYWDGEHPYDRGMIAAHVIRGGQWLDFYLGEISYNERFGGLRPVATSG